MKKIGILGSGTVGQTLGLGFASLGHEVMIGTREPAKLKDWQAKTGARAQIGFPQEAVKFGELIVLATKWEGTRQAIELAGKDQFRHKTVIDVTNPLKSGAEGKAPMLDVGYPDSAGKKIQEWLPDSKVVKAFNIVTASYMTNPKLQEGTPDLFIAGDHDIANKEVAEFAKKWGWSVTDIGGIENAYMLEALAMLWILYGFRNNHWTHAFKLLKK